MQFNKLDMKALQGILQLHSEDVVQKIIHLGIVLKSVSRLFNELNEKEGEIQAIIDKLKEMEDELKKKVIYGSTDIQGEKGRKAGKESKGIERRKGASKGRS